MWCDENTQQELFIADQRYAKLWVFAQKDVSFNVDLISSMLEVCRLYKI